jgi:hypothetical protein
MSQDTNRLLMELERDMREVNRQTINPMIQELSSNGLRPVLSLVASARGRYLKALFSLAAEAPDALPSDDQYEQLAKRRREYEELASGAKALETAIQRGYVDVRPGKR